MSDHEILREFTLKLSLAHRFGPYKFKQFIDEYGSIAEVYNNSFLDYIANLINSSRESYQKVSTLLEDRQIGYKCIWEEDYPQNLKTISDPPIVLYYKGSWDIKIFTSSLSVVGTRNMTSYGKRIIKNLIPELCASGFTIVSGMAFGIDACSHLTAIEVKGKTIAILPASPDVSTPLQNKYLYDRILKSGGLIVSEYPPDSQIAPGMFPRRNRIIAGISLGTLVVEGAANSGAMITANLASGYGRDVFAIPGNIDSRFSEGCNKLIQDHKAKLVKESSDILVEFNNIHTLKPSQFKPRAALEKDFSPNESRIVELLKKEPYSVEEIAVMLKKDISVIIASCSFLEVRDVIIKNEQNRYCLNLN